MGLCRAFILSFGSRLSEFLTLPMTNFMKQNRLFAGLCIAIVLVFVDWLPAAEPVKGVLIELQSGRQLKVRFIDVTRGLKLGPDREALVVWPEQNADRWQYVPPNSQWTASQDAGYSDSAQLFAQSRSTRGAGGETAFRAISSGLPRPDFSPVVLM